MGARLRVLAAGARLREVTRAGILEALNWV